MTALETLDGFDMIFTQTGLLEQDIIGCKKLFDKCKITRDHSGKIRSYDLSRIPFRSCMASYLVNCHSIPKILSLYEEELHKGAELPVDLFIRRKVQEGKLRAVCLFPFVTTDLPGNPSVIGGRAGSATSRLASDIVRRSFYIDRDPNMLLHETAHAVPYDDTDIFATILSRNIHFLMTASHVDY